MGRRKSTPLHTEGRSNRLRSRERLRAVAADALADPYFGALHDDNDEPDAAPFDFSFEDTRDGMPLDEKALRKEIWASSPERR